MKLLVAAKPELDEQTVRDQNSAYMNNLKSPHCASTPFLYNCPEDWQMTQDIMTKYRGIEATKKAEDYYTNDIVPKR